MTVSSTTRSASFTGNGSTTVFPFAYKVFQTSDVLVELTLSGGLPVIQLVGTHYTITLNADQDANPGGSVTMLTAPPAASILQLLSNVPITQNAHLTSVGGGIIEAELDRMAIGVQQVARDLSSAMAGGSVPLFTAVERTAQTGSAKMPAGNTAQRDATPGFGYMRGNSDDVAMEWYNGLSWATFVDERVIQLGAATLLGAVSGADTITAAATPTLSAQAAVGSLWKLPAAAANTGASTLNIDGHGAAALVRPDGTALQANDIPGVGYPCLIEKRASDFVLLNPANLIAQQMTQVQTAGDARYAKTTVRQTVQQGVTNSSGYANMLAAGTGLALNLSATAKALRIAFAAGESDYVSKLSADVSSVVSSLAANNLSYIFADYVSPTSVTWGKTLAPPQYGYAFDRTKQALLHFDGTAGATTIIDDYGNTWTAQGGAKLQTNAVKIGTAALGGGGASNALNGSTDFIRSTELTSLGSGGWAIRFWVQALSLPGSGAFAAYAYSRSTSNYGVLFGVYNSAGTIKFAYSLSSTGTSWDIANNVQGTTTPNTSTWYYIELTYDAVAGIYRMYVNGTQEASTTSSSKINSFAYFDFGTTLNGYIDEIEVLPYCDHPNGTTYTPPVAASSAATAGYSADFFSIPDMTMYRVTAASASAGTPPTLTAVNRVYVGEAVTGAASVSSVVNYALNGKYESPYGAWPGSVGTLTNLNHNSGITPQIKTILATCITAEQGFSVGDEITAMTAGAAGEPVILQLPATRNGISFTTGQTFSLVITNKTTGGDAPGTPANWKYRVITKRGW